MKNFSVSILLFGVLLTLSAYTAEIFNWLEETSIVTMRFVAYAFITTAIATFSLYWLARTGQTDLK